MLDLEEKKRVELSGDSYIFMYIYVFIYIFILILLLTKDESSFCFLQLTNKTKIYKIYNLKNDICHIDENSVRKIQKGWIIRCVWVCINSNSDRNDTPETPFRLDNTLFKTRHCDIFFLFLSFCLSSRADKIWQKSCAYDKKNIKLVSLFTWWELAIFTYIFTRVTG